MDPAYAESKTTTIAPKVTQKLQKSKSAIHEELPQRHVYRHWRSEALVWLLASGLLLGILVLLLNVEGNYVDEWPLPIELNTLVAVLSTILRTCLVIVLEEILSQSKWSWFRREPRPLNQLQTYDEASRGLVGSFKLLKMLRGGFKGDRLAVIAAIVMTLSLTISPFAQQASATTPCAREQRNKQATIRKASFLPPLVTYWEGDIFPELVAEFDYYAEADMKGLISNAFVADDVQNNATLFNCATNECRFSGDTADGPAYSTAGICNLCFDSTEFATFSEPGQGAAWAATVANTMANVSSHVQDEVLMASNHSYLDFAKSSLSEEFLEASRIAILNATIITRKGDEGCFDECFDEISETISDGGSVDGQISAATCTLYPCVKNLRSRVQENILIEDIISTQPVWYVENTEWAVGDTEPLEGDAQRNRNTFLYAVKSPCKVNGKSHEFKDLKEFSEFEGWKMGLDAVANTAYLNESEARDCFYGFSSGYLQNLRDWFQDEFIVAACGYDRRTYGSVGGDVSLGCLEKWWLDPLWLGRGANRYMTDERIYGDETFEHVQEKFNNLAATMTNYFRTIERPEELFTNLPYNVTGVSFDRTLCVEFNWQWLLWPLSLHIVTGIGLVWITLRDKADDQQATWKSSLLPLLLFDFERIPEHDDTGGSATPREPSEDIEEIRGFSERTMVHLKQSDWTKRSAFVEQASSSVDVELSEHETSAQKGTQGWVTTTLLRGWFKFNFGLD